MATKKNTDIRFTTIKQKAKESHLKEKYELEDGSTISFYPIFPSSLIDEMLKEIQITLQTKDEQIEMSEEMTMKYVLFMCIKHFTHLKNQLKATTFVEQLNEMQSIVDAELFDLIIEEVFLQSEIQKVFDKLAKISGKFLFLEKMNQKMQDEFSKIELKNKDIFANLNIQKQIPEV
jgi:hypothetical protein